MAFWFDDESMDEIRWGYMGSSSTKEETPEEKENRLQKDREIFFSDLNKAIEKVKNGSLCQMVFLPVEVNNDVNSKINAIPYKHIMNNTHCKLWVLNDNFNIKTFSESIDETWIKTTEAKKIVGVNVLETSTSITEVNTYTTTSEAYKELINYLDPTHEYCVLAKETHTYSHKPEGKIFNLKKSYDYTLKFFRLNREAMSRYTEVSKDDFTFLFLYSQLSEFKEIVNDNEKIAKLISIEEKLEKFFDKFGVEYIPAKPMVLSLVRKIKEGKIK